MDSFSSFGLRFLAKTPFFKHVCGVTFKDVSNADIFLYVLARYPKKLAVL